MAAVCKPGLVLITRLIRKYYNENRKYIINIGQSQQSYVMAYKRLDKTMAMRIYRDIFNVIRRV